jgi:antitoxin (DNA-binding transcriptional repressor) of toxin-antitoxin stability system
MQLISVGDFKTDFSEILKQIQNSGEKYIIQYGKKQTKVAIIVPYDDSLVKSESRKFGIYKGKGSFKMHDDFAMSEEELLLS